MPKSQSLDDTTHTTVSDGTVSYNSVFLNWIADRLVHVHGENPNVDYVLKLREMAREQR